MDVRRETIRCKQCGAQVRDDWAPKWKHVVRVHPEIVATYLLPLIENPLEAERFGEALGSWFKSRVM